MKRDLRNRIKEENGSVTLFVLVTCMFVLVILLLTNMEMVNKNSNQKRTLEQIQNNYEVTEEDLERTYHEVYKENT